MTFPFLLLALFSLTLAPPRAAFATSLTHCSRFPLTDAVEQIWPTACAMRSALVHASGKAGGDPPCLSWMQKKLTAIAMVSVCIRDVSYKTKDFFWLPPLTLLLAEGSVLPCNVPELGVFLGQNLWCFSSRASTLLTRSKGMGT